MPLKFFKNFFKPEKNEGNENINEKIEVSDSSILNDKDNKKSIDETKNAPRENMFNKNFNPRNYERILENSVEQILIKNFPTGYRKNSMINQEKFKEYWENTYGSPINIENNEIDEYISKVGMVYKNIVYSPQTIISNETKEKILSYIDSGIDSGKPAIYYTSLFEKFLDDLAGSHIYSSEMLREYLRHINHGKYYIHEDYITSKRINSADDALYISIKEYLKQTFIPVSVEELTKKFSDVPKDNIKKILNKYAEFVYNNNDEYFYVDSMLISSDELSGISSIMEKSINEHGFLETEELVKIIGDKYPSILEQNPLITSTGLHNVLKCKLKREFSFKGHIISSSKSEMSMSKIFIDFCKGKNHFTLDQLKSINNVIYFDSVYKYSIRINETEFISKSLISFDVVEIDKTIDKFCVGDYIPIKSIESFVFFPHVGTAWNSFLLEQYVAQYSRKYKLIHSGYSKTKCVGAIVKKTSSINSFDDLIIDAISKSNVKFQKNTVLQYLVDNGYIARKSYDKIDYALIKAKELYNRSERS